MSRILACLRSWLDGGQKDGSLDLIARILDAHNTLIGLDDLSPGELTNKTLGGLVALCCESHDSVTIKRILTHPRIRRILPSLRRISSDSEYCLEAYWNSHIVTRAQDPKDALQLLKSFPYFQNYVELARMELCSLYAIEPVLPSRVAFLGSGPLPLTSMCLLRSLRDGLIPQQAAPMFDDGQEGQGPLVVNIDHDANALVSSTILCEKLGSWSQGMAFQCSDASSALDLGSFDVTIIAALVGVTQQEKEDIIISVAQRMRPGALMVVRSAHGLRTVLYPEVDLSSDRIREVLQVETVTHPYSKVVNSIIIARVKGSTTLPSKNE